MSLADLTEPEDDAGETTSPLSIEDAFDRVISRAEARPIEIRLLVRDLADGGRVAVEALEPTLRAALEGLRFSVGAQDELHETADLRALFLDLAAPLLLVMAAWPVLERTLDIDPSDRPALLSAACRRALLVHGLAGASEPTARTSPENDSKF